MNINKSNAVTPNWDIGYDADDSSEEREAWRQEIEHDRRIFNDPAIKQRLDDMVSQIVSNRKRATKPARVFLDELNELAEEVKSSSGK
jgi:hydrogenase maturation factor HypF (carbamoyltransferase family)